MMDEKRLDQGELLDDQPRGGHGERAERHVREPVAYERKTPQHEGNAQQSGTERVVINSGAKSENYLRKAYPQLPRQAFVEYGNYIGETIKIAGELGIKKLTLGIMMGKAVKLAAGNLDTHSRKTTFDIQFILSMLEEAGCGGEIMEQARHITLARELWDIIPNPILQSFCEVVI